MTDKRSVKDSSASFQKNGLLSVRTLHESSRDSVEVRLASLDSRDVQLGTELMFGPKERHLGHKFRNAIGRRDKTVTACGNSALLMSEVNPMTLLADLRELLDLSQDSQHKVYFTCPKSLAALSMIERTKGRFESQ